MIYRERCRICKRYIRILVRPVDDLSTRAGGRLRGSLKQQSRQAANLTQPDPTQTHLS